MAGITGLAVHEYHLWQVDKVKALITDHDEAMTFFYGGSGNFAKFMACSTTSSFSRSTLTPRTG